MFSLLERGQATKAITNAKYTMIQIGPISSLSDKEFIWMSALGGEQMTIELLFSMVKAREQYFWDRYQVSAEIYGENNNFTEKWKERWSAVFSLLVDIQEKMEGENNG